ncbi:MAG: hypothetical protein PUA85_03805 [Oscillospiraceae bacterium]|nr:hypothetical protein [Oscillospiraceae bacterium]
MANIKSLQNMNPYVLRNRLYLKEFFAKPLIFISGIFYLVSAGLSVILDYLAIAPVKKMLSHLVNTGAVQLKEDFSFSLSVSLPVATIAIGVALILMFKASRNQNPASSPNAGLTIIWILAIANFVSLGAIALVFLAIIAFLIVLLVNPNAALTPVWDYVEEFISRYGSSSLDITSHEMAQIFFIAMLVSMVISAVIVIGFDLFVAISTYQFSSSMRNSARTEYLSCKGARRYGVINLIGAVSNFSSAAMLIVYTALLFTPDANDALKHCGLTAADLLPLMIGSVIAGALMGVLGIFLSKIGFGYRNHILAAGAGGENLPLPVVVAADLGEAQPVTPAAPITASENVYAPAETPAPLEAPAEKAAPVEAPTEEKITLQNANPEARQIVEEALENISKDKE